MFLKTVCCVCGARQLLRFERKDNQHFPLAVVSLSSALTFLADVARKERDRSVVQMSRNVSGKRVPAETQLIVAPGRGGGVLHVVCGASGSVRLTVVSYIVYTASSTAF